MNRWALGGGVALLVAIVGWDTWDRREMRAEERTQTALFLGRLAQIDSRLAALSPSASGGREERRGPRDRSGQRAEESTPIRAEGADLAGTESKDGDEHIGAPDLGREFVLHPVGAPGEVLTRDELTIQEHEWLELQLQQLGGALHPDLLLRGDDAMFGAIEFKPRRGESPTAQEMTAEDRAELARLVVERDRAHRRALEAAVARSVLVFESNAAAREHVEATWGKDSGKQVVPGRGGHVVIDMAETYSEAGLVDAKTQLDEFGARFGVRFKVCWASVGG